MITTGLSFMSALRMQQATAEPDPGICGSVSEHRVLLNFHKIEPLKVWWHAAFFLFSLSFSYITWLLMNINDEAGG
jgi:hypothetical protein